MPIRTKVICTMGPAVASLEKILALIDAGMNVARLNFSHGDHTEHARTINLLKQAREKRGVPLAIMIDTKGPEIRIDRVKGGAIQVKKGDLLTLVREFDDKTDHISLHPFEAFQHVKKGTQVLFDNGYVISEVVEMGEGRIVVEIQNPGVLKDHKGINLPNVPVHLPAMTEKDIRDLAFACEHDVEYIAASFIRSAEHALSIKEFLAEKGKPDILVISKIENGQGIENFDSIIQVSDGIMVARGDLGVEVDLALVPKLQKMMIRKCYHACKPVVTATQMLESMIVNPRPTRAEVSDVANAIYDSSSAVMLSGETAVGNYPIETVEQMVNIAHEAEKDFNYKDFFYIHSKRDYHDISSAVAMSAVKTAYSTDAKAVFAFTSSGFTVRLVSRLRPEMPIVALTDNRKVYHQLAFNWGVIPCFTERCANAAEAFSITSEFALEKGIVRFGDIVIVTSGSPFGKQGSTNMMMVEHIGDIIVKGSRGVGNKVEGKVEIVLSADRHQPESVKGKLLLIARCDSSYLPLMKEAAGVIMQNHMDDTASERYLMLVAKTFEIPAVYRADGILSLVQEGELVTLDPQKGLIYRGREIKKDRVSS